MMEHPVANRSALVAAMSDDYIYTNRHIQIHIHWIIKIQIQADFVTNTNLYCVAS